MKTLSIIALLFFFSTGTVLTAQENRARKEEKEKNTIKEVEQVNKASEEISSTAANTSKAVKSTVANTKDALNEIGTLFGTGKGEKKPKSKGLVSIGIQAIAYDDENLNALYSAISSVKGVKNPSKKFSSGNVAITLAYKGSADALWQSIPKAIRTNFQMIEMADKHISIQPKTNQ